jgi:hypothetical protein
LLTLSPILLTYATLRAAQSQHKTHSTQKESSAFQPDTARVCCTNIPVQIKPLAATRTAPNHQQLKDCSRYLLSLAPILLSYTTLHATHTAQHTNTRSAFKSRHSKPDTNQVVQHQQTCEIQTVCHHSHGTKPLATQRLQQIFAFAGAEAMG